MDHRNIFLLAKESAPLNVVIGYREREGGYIVNILSFLIPAGTIIFVPKAHLKVARKVSEFEILGISPGRRKTANPRSLKTADFIGGKKYHDAINIAPLVYSGGGDFVEDRYNVACNEVGDAFFMQEKILYI